MWEDWWNSNICWALKEGLWFIITFHCNKPGSSILLRQYEESKNRNEIRFIQGLYGSRAPAPTFHTFAWQRERDLILLHRNLLTNSDVHRGRKKKENRYNLTPKFLDFNKLVIYLCLFKNIFKLNFSITLTFLFFLSRNYALLTVLKNKDPSRNDLTSKNNLMQCPVGLPSSSLYKYYFMID